MRGSKTLSNIFTTESLNNHVKGRSGDLIKARNWALLHRFYFYSSFTDFKYEKIIERVSCDFYLMGTTTIQILGRESKSLSDIRKEKPSIAKLKGMFTQYNWTLGGSTIH